MTELKTETVQTDVDAELPWLVFMLHNLKYTVNSRIVTTILQMPDSLTPVASSPEMFRGVLNFRGDVLPLLDLRKLLGIISVQDEQHGLTSQIEKIKQSHLDWVRALESTIVDDVPFGGNLDPHTCDLGHWIDSMLGSTSEATSNVILTYLRSVQPIHDSMHSTGRTVLESVKKLPHDRRASVLDGDAFKNIVRYTEDIVSKLSSLQDEYINSMREMVVVVSDGSVQLGMIVDEVVAVDSLDIVSGDEKFPSFQETKYFSGVAESAKIPGEILLVNEPLLLGTLDRYSTH